MCKSPSWSHYYKVSCRLQASSGMNFNSSLPPPPNQQQHHHHHANTHLKRETIIKGGRLWRGTPCCVPPFASPIHYSYVNNTCIAEQLSVCGSYKEAWVKVGMRRRGEEGVGWCGETRMYADGWEVGNTSGAVQWCSAIWWEAHFSCMARPRTCWVIRAMHLASPPPPSPTPPRVRRRMGEIGGRMALHNCLLSSWYLKAVCTSICWWALSPLTF